MKKENALSILSAVLAIAVVMVIGYCAGTMTSKEQNRKILIEQEYYPLSEVMLLNEYKEVESTEYKWEKSVANVQIAVIFDFRREVCMKNDYAFSLKKAYLQEDGIMYVHKDVLEKMLNCRLSFDPDKEVKSVPVSYEPHQWTTEFPSLIAHAGGAVRTRDYNSFYCNSIEALAENYSLGHRVFEIDFNLTSDQKLAAVHDWNHQGNFNGEALSEAEWKNAVVVGQPAGEFTTMMIEDILDEMLVNKDMFIVTDTKYEGIEALHQFQLIYDAAVERDRGLLDRVIPQIYNEDMYELIMSVYEFPSVIYTVYATDASADSIIAFATAHENIKVITASIEDGRFGVSEIERIHDNDLLIYNHTIHTFSELTTGKSRGIDGFYTGLLLPRDLELYEEKAY